jgi:hypothetical protein
MENEEKNEKNEIIFNILNTRQKLDNKQDDNKS